MSTRNMNPGEISNLNKKCSNLLPAFFDGFQVIINRNLSSHFRVSHSIYLSSITPGNYRFGATYVGTKEISPHVGSPVLFGDIDSRGNLNANIYHIFGSRFKIRFDAQMENRSFSTSQLATHYLGDTFTASALMSHYDLFKRTGCMIFQILKSLTPGIALGAEVAYINLKSKEFYPKYIPETQLSMYARYTTEHSCWSSILSPNNILLCCYQKASDQLSFSMEINTNFRSNQSVGTVAYQVKLKDRGIVFRGMLDTNSNVGSIFEKRVCDSPFGFSVSANLNHRENNFRLGLGFVIE